MFRGSQDVKILEPLSLPNVGPSRPYLSQYLLRSEVSA